MSGSGIVTQVPLVPMMFFSVCCIVFTAMVLATTVEDATALSGTGNVTGGDANFSGGEEQCDGFFSCTGLVLGYLWDGFSFNIEGAPFWVRIPIAVFYTVTIVLGVLSVMGMFTL